MKQVYFENKAIIFSASPVSDAEVSLHPVGREELDPAKLLQIIGNNNILAVISPDPERSFAEFSSWFLPVEAAGGLVSNRAGEVLMILRKGWWDLPKGHVEEGETTLQAALREVSEETGLAAPEAGELITETYHFYNTYGRWELKRTSWFAMTAGADETVVPQTEEQITEIRWLRSMELWQALAHTYSTIRYVFSAWLE